MAESSRLDELLEAVEQRALLPGPPFVVALSGGADSAAQAFLAARTGELRSCLHVHHGLPGSDSLADAARSIADTIGAKLETVSVTVPPGPSPENQARIARFEAFGRVVPDAMNVLLAHTRNDQAETVLLNLIRGSGTRGLTAMSYHRAPNIYRPLLDVTRSETRELAALAGLPFVDDPSNRDLAIRRNKIRAEILPRLEELNPNLVDALARLARQTADDEALLESRAAQIPIWGDEHGVSVSASALLVVPFPVQVRVLRRLVASIREGGGITSAELDRISQVLDGSTAAAQLESGLRVTREGALLRLTRSTGQV